MRLVEQLVQHAVCAEAAIDGQDAVADADFLTSQGRGKAAVEISPVENAALMDGSDGHERLVTGAGRSNVQAEPEVGAKPLLDLSNNSELHCA